MLNQSIYTTAYLRRRVRLFQVSSSQLIYKCQPILDQYQQPIKSQTNDWIIKLGQSLSAQVIIIKKIKKIISNIQPISISKCGKQILQWIKLAIQFQLPTKISNTIYYLCRRNYQFRQKLAQYLQQLCDKLRSQKWCRIKGYKCIILTDLFLFGIYFTGKQFVNNILPLVFKLQVDQCNLQQRNRLQNFKLFYISHYFQVLNKPMIMIDRNRSKLIQYSLAFVKSYITNNVENSQKQMKSKLQQLQNTYIIQHISQSAIKVSQKQKQYLQAVNNYQYCRKQILYVISTVINARQSNSSYYTQYYTLFGLVQKQYDSMLKYQNQNEQKQQNMQIQKIKQSILQVDSQIQPKSAKLKHKQNQQELLSKIYNSCKYFKNSTKYIKDQVYTANFTFIKKQIDQFQKPKFIDVLPEEYIEKIKNCTDISTANQLATLFLDSYNKHGNRQILIDKIFKQLFQRNNLLYIMRTLYNIYLVQTEQIADLLKEQISTLKERTVMKLARGIFGKFSNVIIQLIKFKLYDSVPYLEELNCHIKGLDGFSQEKQIIAQLQNNNSNNKNGKEFKHEALYILDFINLIQKLGREVYYQSVNAHIKFNEIIASVYRHFNIRSIRYDIETISRFNSLVSFLQNLSQNDNDNSNQSVITVQELKDNKKFKQIVANLEKQLKKTIINSQAKSNLNKIINTLVNSISSQNYIHSYYYAQLVYKVGSKTLDEAIKNATLVQVVDKHNAGNYQGAANWCRFLGQLHRSAIVNQKELIQFLDRDILQKYSTTNKNIVIKLIASALEPCKQYLKKTQRRSQIEQTLYFLIKVKKLILESEGLSNTILQHQITQIIEYFHPVFKYIKSSKQLSQIDLLLVGDERLQKILDAYQQIQIQRQQRNQQKKLIQDDTQDTSTIISNLNSTKYVQKQQKKKTSKKIKKYNQAKDYRETIDDNIKMWRAICQQNGGTLEELAIIQYVQPYNQVQIKSINKHDQNEKNDFLKLTNETPKKEATTKTVKVVGRRKNLGNKLSEVQIMMQ